MKKLIKIIITIAVLAGIVFGIYKVFFDCKGMNIPFKQEFTLKTFDYAKVGDEAIVKLMRIEDFRCKDNEDCKGDGELEYKIIVINDHKIAYVKLGSVANTKRDIEKLGYRLSFINAESDDSVTLKLVRLEKKVKV